MQNKHNKREFIIMTSEPYHYTIETLVDPNTGFVFSEIYLRNGVLHREDGPARITRNTDEGRIIEEWYYDGKRHREDGGPAVVVRFMPHEEVTVRQYFRHDKPFSPPHPELA